MKTRLYLTISIMGVVLFHGLSTNNLADFTFRKIADTSTLIPDRVVTFDRFSFPSIDGGNVVFMGIDPSGKYGIYIYINGILSVVADTTTPVPRLGGGSFSFFSGGYASIHGEDVAFIGQGPRGKSQMGIYTYINGELDVVADSVNTEIPGDPLGENFSNFFRPSLEDGNLAFRGTGPSGQAGIYTYINGELRVIADKNTLGNVVFDLASFDAGDVAFAILNPLSRRAIYTYFDGTLSIFADTDTQAPGGTGSFWHLRDTWLDGRKVVFVGLSPGPREGVYSNISGKLDVVADTDTGLPEGTGTFRGFNDASLDNGNIAFSNKDPKVSSSRQLGIYTNLGGQISKVININDTLDGKTITSFDCRREALSGLQIAFLARFTDGSQGIFVAVASDPSLPVELTSFNGTMTSDGVLLTWKTHSETNNLGFHVYRSQSKDDTYSRITTRLIKGHGSSGGTHDYTFLDETVEARKNYWYLIEDVDFSGVTERSFPIQVVSRRQVVSQVIKPTRFALHQNYPNPFNPETWIPYDLAAEAFVTIAIYDATGQQIRKLFLGKKSAGAYLPKDKATYWNGRNDSGELVPGGIYFYTLQIDEAVPRRDATTFRAVRKMIILK